MKKKWILIPALIVSLACAVGGTMAYFVAKDTAHNVITSGKVEIAIVETMKKPGQSEEEPFPSEGITNVMPGTKVSKIVRVKNLDTVQPCWLRVKLTTKVSADVPADKIGSAITVNAPVNDKWEYHDGYYYYTEVLGAGQTTEVLMDTVSFSAPNMGNEYQNSTVNILVSAQAVQAKNNDAASPWLAKGWPAEDQA